MQALVGVCDIFRADNVKKGIMVDLTKIEAIHGWARPTSIIAVRSFISLVGCYRGFVEGFSTMLHHWLGWLANVFLLCDLSSVSWAFEGLRSCLLLVLFWVFLLRTRLYHILWCIWCCLWVCSDAAGLSCYLCFWNVASSRAQLSYSWPKVGSSSFHAQNLKALLIQNLLQGIQISSQPLLCHELEGKGHNSRQRCWVELLADYDISILHCSGKTNIVVDTLSRKAVSMVSLTYLPIREWPLPLDIRSLANGMVRLDISDSRQILVFVGAQSSLFD